MESKTKTPTATAENSLSITRIFNAPRELVWEAWTDPKHIAQWWGPTGFTTTIQDMEVKEGGIWNLVLHGPDGVDYKNKSIFDTVKRPELIIFRHVTPPIFTCTVTFKKYGSKTRLQMTMVFESEKDFRLAVDQHGAREGQKQTIGRLQEYLRLM